MFHYVSWEMSIGRFECEIMLLLSALIGNRALV